MDEEQLGENQISDPTPAQKAMSELGRIGGNANIKKHGKERMSKISKERWKRSKNKSKKHGK